MKKSILALVVVLTVSFSSLAWCESKVFQLSVTIPAIVALNSSPNSQSLSSNQMIQTEQLIRSSKAITVTSIVVP